jgi:hypothetical protein
VLGAADAVGVPLAQIQGNAVRVQGQLLLIQRLVGEVLQPRLARQRLGRLPLFYFQQRQCLVAGRQRPVDVHSISVTNPRADGGHTCTGSSARHRCTSSAKSFAVS